MCGRYHLGVRTFGPFIVEGLEAWDHRGSNLPRRHNDSAGQELLVIRENHKTGERPLGLLKWD